MGLGRRLDGIGMWTKIQFGDSDERRRRQDMIKVMMEMEVVLTMTARPPIGAATHRPTAKGHHMGAGRKRILDLPVVLDPVRQAVEIPGPASKLASKACYISMAGRPPTAATVRK